MIALHYFKNRDYPMAAQYLQQSIDLGDGRAMKFLANMYESGYLGRPDPAKAADLRLRAERLDPDSPDPSPARLPMLRQTSAANPPTSTIARRRPYVVYRYNPVWQGAPNDTTCCPNNMLVCPLGPHFCGH